MRRLLAKDLRLVAPFWWLIAPLHALWCVQAFLVPELYFWLSLAAALAWTAVIAVLDWQFEGDRLLGSLPPVRAQVVRARYVSAGAGLVAGAVLFVAYGGVALSIGGDRLLARWGGAATFSSPDTVAAFLLVGGAALIVFLPFNFRFGLPLGAGLFAPTVLVGGSVAAAALSRLAGHPPEPAAAQAGLSASETVRWWLSSLAASWGPGAAAGVLLAGAILLGAGSLWLSTRFYERREL